MRFRFALCLLMMIGLVDPVPAQRVPSSANTATMEMMVDALQELNVLSLREGETLRFDLQGRHIILYRLDKGNRLLVKSLFKQQPSLEVLNRYNETTAVTTRAVRYAKLGLFLEAGLDCQIGISTQGLQRFLTTFASQIIEFENFIAKQETPLSPDVMTAKRKIPLNTLANSDDREFVITFPTNDSGKWETAWKIIWDMETGKQVNEQGFKFGKGRDGATVLFKIKQAYFKPGQQSPWIQVLEDAHPSEFYVPYFFRGTRFYDLKGVGSYVSLSPKEGGPVSQTLGKARRVMAELRDRGPAYKHGNMTRRAEELTLWANFVASNYTYLIEYGFQDDGTIVFRHAPTGYNFFNHMDAAHMHGSYWRVGMKLGPEGKNNQNQVYIVRLPTDPKDQGDKGKLNIEEVNRECFCDWNPQEFTRIRVSNPNYSIVPQTKDRAALPISYDLVTQVQGIARHERFRDEKFSLHDFWITRQDSPEKMYINLGDYFFTPKGEENPNLRLLEQQNVVLWHSSSALHVPRAEDGILAGNDLNHGQALVYWTTFELRPRNLFLKTPIYRSLP